MTFAVLTIAGAAVLAFANGANDVSKGVATLAGSRRASYRAAIAWGTVWTFAGGLASLVISVGLVKVFTSAIIGPNMLAASSFPVAVTAGAAAWVMLATVTGLPVSTTHALTGAIVGVALMAGGITSVNWWILLSSIVAPLALSPAISGIIGYGTHAVAARLSPSCVCVEEAIAPVVIDSGGTLTGVLVPHIVATTDGCSPADGRWCFMPAGVLHWGAAAALSFARGVNDNAKIAAIGALGVTTLGSDLWLVFGVTAAAMTAGSYIAGLRVTETLGERVVHMDHDTGLAAALVAAGLVLAASFYTLPVSTTHVSTGAIIGAGLGQRHHVIEWRRVASFVSAWLVTLPIAAALAALASWLLRAFV
jgi:PiT family inorganic phosphate transporter